MCDMCVSLWVLFSLVCHAGVFFFSVAVDFRLCLGKSKTVASGI
jgi:hypothetical protein